ncbi:hypothetical protein FACS189415_6640 [Bacteroidia bacterium]|nr:hypothetical protein FACS189415_6640 [Bacteroidia bacterium]
MSDYVIMTDSDSELDMTYCQMHDVPVLLMPYIIHDQEFVYSPGVGFDAAAFYAQLRDGTIVTTAGRNPNDFIDLWEPLLRQGKDILYIGVSSALSNTFSNSVLARDTMLQSYPQRTIRLVDTLRISMPMGLMVMQAIEMREQGQAVDAVADWLEQNKLRFRAWFTVDDLGYLKRGGRLSGAAAFMGTILNIKPILHISDEGKLVPIDKQKGRKKALLSLLEMAEAEMAPPEEHRLAIMHADCIEDADWLRRKLSERHNCKDILVLPVGPVIGSHAGPRTMALCYYAKA